MTSTQVTYIIRGTDGITFHSIETNDEKEVARIKETGHFTYHMPEMWPDKCTEGNAKRYPAYDIECRLVSIEKMTTTKITTSEYV